MADVTLSYKGSDILELSNSGSATLKTGGTYCEDDIAVEYVKPSGEEDLLEKRITDALSSYRTTKTLTLAQTSFGNMTSLESVFVPNCSCGIQAFVGCSNLTTAVIYSSNNFTFQNCKKLAIVDYTGGIIWSSSHRTNTILTTIILRNNNIETLGNSNVFVESPFASGGGGGTIYIPKALYDHLGDGSALDYKSATNWSTIDGYGTITWAKIEGSYYETHYADGTVIS